MSQISVAFPSSWKNWPPTREFLDYFYLCHKSSRAQRSNVHWFSLRECYKKSKNVLNVASLRFFPHIQTLQRKKDTSERKTRNNMDLLPPHPFLQISTMNIHALAPLPKQVLDFLNLHSSSGFTNMFISGKLKSVDKIMTH